MTPAIEPLFACRARFLMAATGIILPLLAALVAPWNSPAGEQVEDKKGKTGLHDLLTRLKGGPIEIRPLEQVVPVLFPRDKAMEIAQKHLGFTEVPSQAWLVTATDREFMGGCLRNRLCWLLECRDLVQLKHKGQQTPFPVLMYALVDGKTGVFWEAFTRPVGAWWNRMKYKNEEIISHFERAEIAWPAPTPPKTALHKILQSWADTGPPLFFYEETEQVIARYFRYTQSNSGMGIQRVEEMEIIPYYFDVPLWYISFLGIRIKAGSGDFVNQEENNYYRAENGKQMKVNYYR